MTSTPIHQATNDAAGASDADAAVQASNGVAADVDAGTGASVSLKRRFINASGWTLFLYGVQQVLRFGSNLLLTYLLVPEMFGLMAYVSMLMIGLHMFTDIGLGPNIIQRKGGEDPEFLNTAWTMQVIRGGFLWVCSCILAYPASLIWDPALLYLFPVAALTAVIGGFNATSVYVLNRRLTLSRLTYMHLASQIVSIGVMVAWAWISPTVWALVAGGLVGTAMSTIMSHFLLSEQRNRFHWNPAAARELFNFGRWVFFSTILTYVATHVSTLLYGYFLGVSLLGVFWIALNLAKAIQALGQQLAGTVGFPALSELYRRDIHAFYYRLRHVRLMLTVPFIAALLLVCWLGPWFVSLVYHENYWEAGWMLSFLAAAFLAERVNTTYGNAYMAMGRPDLVMLVVFLHVVVGLPLIIIGYHLAGAQGFLMGFVAEHWVMYIAYMIISRRMNIWQGKLDVMLLAVSAMGVSLWLLFQWQV